MKKKVFIGFPGDTFCKAENRIKKALKLGYSPEIVIYESKSEKTLPLWNKFRSQWIKEIKEQEIRIKKQVVLESIVGEKEPTKLFNGPLDGVRKLSMDNGCDSRFSPYNKKDGGLFVRIVGLD